MFTAPRAGVYLITFSYWSNNDPAEVTSAYLHHNGQKWSETLHYTKYSSSGSGYVRSTGGRSVYQKLEAGNTLTLQTDRVSGDMGNIMFCVQFIDN